MNYQAKPLSGDPQKPAGLDTTALDGLWSNVGWAVAAVACFALVGCAVMAWSNHRHGESNQGVQKAGVVFAALFAIGLIPALVGTVTGT